MAKTQTRNSVAKKQSKKKQTTQSSRAGLIFPVGRLHRLLKQGRYSQNIGKGGAVFMAGVLQYLTSEVMELAGEACHDKKKKTVAPKHVQMAIRGDPELNKMMAHTLVSKGGSVPLVHSALFPGKKGTTE